MLFGQPELDERLNDKEVRQLKQRITFSYKLQPIDREGMELYLTHRLNVAGYKGGNLFEINAMSRLFKASRGIPRLINILSHKSMMSAYGQGTKFVNKNNMQAAIKDTEDAQLRHTDNNKNRWLIAAAGILIALAITYVFLR